MCRPTRRRVLGPYFERSLDRPRAFAHPAGAAIRSVSRSPIATAHRGRHSAPSSSSLHHILILRCHAATNAQQTCERRGAVHFTHRTSERASDAIRRRPGFSQRLTPRSASARQVVRRSAFYPNSSDIRNTFNAKRYRAAIMKSNGRFVGISTTPSSVARTAWPAIVSSWTSAARERRLRTSGARSLTVAVCLVSLGYCVTFGVEASGASALGVAFVVAAVTFAAAPQRCAAIRRRQALCPVASDDPPTARCPRRAHYDSGAAGRNARSLKDTTPLAYRK
jgi:hypothetical protein